MKYRTTKKAVIQGHNNCICVNYCGLQTLLQHIPPAAYTVRREGWAADIYELPGGNCIVTGYAPFGNIRPSYDTMREYEKKAESILYDYTNDNPRDDLEKLLTQFTNDVLQEVGK